MGIIKLIASFFKVFLFFGGLWKEKDAKKSKAKAEVGKKIVEAFKETDPDLRASRLNSAVDDINRLRL